MVAVAVVGSLKRKCVCVRVCVHAGVPLWR
jgi:hypothetical protein